VKVFRVIYLLMSFSLLQYKFYMFKMNDKISVNLKLSSTDTCQDYLNLVMISSAVL